MKLKSYDMNYWKPKVGINNIQEWAWEVTTTDKRDSKSKHNGQYDSTRKVQMASDKVLTQRILVIIPPPLD